MNKCPKCNSLMISSYDVDCKTKKGKFVKKCVKCRYEIEDKKGEKDDR